MDEKPFPNTCLAPLLYNLRVFRHTQQQPYLNKQSKDEQREHPKRIMVGSSCIQYRNMSSLPLPLSH